MQNETRVNLKHLLEDIRDSYTAPLEEVILTELIANALDGRASNVHFTIDPVAKFIRSADDGCGMKRSAIREYHNIAASAKTRGTGIGFAGIGAKLSLLTALKVVTESRGGYGTQSATEWSLTNPYRAPWKFIPFAGNVKTSRGTSVTIYFADEKTRLLDLDFVEKTVIKHFYPLLAEKFYSRLLRYFYKKPINFFVNGKRILLPEEKWKDLEHWFTVTVGKNRRSEGLGFIVKTGQEPDWLQKMLGEKAPQFSLPPGLWISTFGKVIKGGWEWLGITPKNGHCLVGLVEVPALSQILTTNKNDFLSDSGSLKKYYRFRKAIQEAVLPVLRLLGEDQSVAPLPPDKIIRPLNRAVVGALNRLVGEFPELESLLAVRRTAAPGHLSKEKEENEKDLAVDIESDFAKNAIDGGGGRGELSPSDAVRKNKPRMPFGVADSKGKREVKAETAGLKLALGELIDASELPLGRVMEDILTINTAHPAWRKAKQNGMEEYHIIVTVAATLSQFLENEKSAHNFLNRLLVAWANELKQPEKEKKLF